MNEERKPGYYRVKHYEEWMIALLGHDGYWYLPYGICYNGDQYIQEVAEPPITPEPPKESDVISFANWLTKNFWVFHGRIGDNAIWCNELPGSEWGEGEQKTTPELYEIYKAKELKGETEMNEYVKIRWKDKRGVYGIAEYNTEDKRGLQMAINMIESILKDKTETK